MAKFGELIDLETPILIGFYREKNHNTESFNAVLNEVAEDVKKKAKVIKIDVDKNRSLCKALKIDKIPSIVVYNNREMVWRENGVQKAESLISVLQGYF